MSGIVQIHITRDLLDEGMFNTTEIVATVEIGEAVIAEEGGWNHHHTIRYLKDTPSLGDVVLMVLKQLLQKVLKHYNVISPTIVCEYKEDYRGDNVEIKASVKSSELEAYSATPDGVLTYCKAGDNLSKVEALCGFIEYIIKQLGVPHA